MAGFHICPLEEGGGGDQDAQSQLSRGRCHWRTAPPPGQPLSEFTAGGLRSSQVAAVTPQWRKLRIHANNQAQVVQQ